MSKKNVKKKMSKKKMSKKKNVKKKNVKKKNVNGMEWNGMEQPLSKRKSKRSFKQNINFVHNNRQILLGTI